MTRPPGQRQRSCLIAFFDLQHHLTPAATLSAAMETRSGAAGAEKTFKMGGVTTGG